MVFNSLVVLAIGGLTLKTTLVLRVSMNLNTKIIEHNIVKITK